MRNRFAENEARATGDSGQERSRTDFKTIASDLETESATENLETVRAIDRHSIDRHSIQRHSVDRHSLVASVATRAEPDMGNPQASFTTVGANASKEWVDRPVRIAAELNPEHSDEAAMWLGIQPTSAQPTPAETALPPDSGDAAPTPSAEMLVTEDRFLTTETGRGDSTAALRHPSQRWPANEQGFHARLGNIHPATGPSGKENAVQPNNGDFSKVTGTPAPAKPATASPAAAESLFQGVASGAEQTILPESVSASSHNSAAPLSAVAQGSKATTRNAASSEPATVSPTPSGDADALSVHSGTADIVDSEAAGDGRVQAGETTLAVENRDRNGPTVTALYPERQHTNQILGDAWNRIPSNAETAVPPGSLAITSVSTEPDAIRPSEVASSSLSSETAARPLGHGSHMAGVQAFSAIASREPSEALSQAEESGFDELFSQVENESRPRDLAFAESFGSVTKATSPVFADTVANSRPAFDLSGQVAEALVLGAVNHGHGGENVSQLRVELDPPRLGNLALEITQGDQSVRVRIVAESANTHFLLQQEKQGLIDLFQDQGRSVEVDISWQQQQDFRGQGRGESAPQSPFHHWRADGDIRDAAPLASRSQIKSEHAVDITI